MSKSFLLTAGFLLTYAVCNLIIAQIPNPPGPAIVPLDGGLSLLVAACAGFGAKKIYNVKMLKSTTASKK